MGNLVEHPLKESKTESLTRSITNGKIVGKKFDLGSGKIGSAYLGIPYAKPPVGSLRFEKPQPPSNWSQTRDCRQHGPRAPQKDSLWERMSVEVPVDEDCLYLNVFLEESDPPSEMPNGKPVIFFIHGGGFSMHSSVHYGDYGICKYLCRKGVIVVTIQYRLGILGFMATGDNSCVANLGLWDQAMALQWTKTNISAFGGDPDNIVVMGHGAGAASADFLGLSPVTRDLFSKSVLLSGCGDCEWSITDALTTLQTIREFAKDLGWRAPMNDDNHVVNKDLMEFLRKQPASAFQVSLTKRDGIGEAPYDSDLLPVIDGEFLPYPISVLRKETPKRRMIIGTTEYESLIYAGLRYDRYDKESLESFIATRIMSAHPSHATIIQNDAIATYIPNGIKKKDITKKCINLLSDIFMNNGVERCAAGMVQHDHTVYLYNFTYYNPKSSDTLGRYAPIKGASYGSELPFFFGRGILSKFAGTADDMKMLQICTTFLTNFAKYGDPNEKNERKWEPLDETNTYKYLQLSLSPKMENNFHGKRNEIWEKVEKNVAEPGMTAELGDEMHIQLPVVNGEIRCLTVVHEENSCTEPANDAATPDTLGEDHVKMSDKEIVNNKSQCEKLDAESSQESSHKEVPMKNSDEVMNRESHQEQLCAESSQKPHHEEDTVEVSDEKVTNTESHQDQMGAESSQKAPYEEDTVKVIDEEVTNTESHQAQPCTESNQEPPHEEAAVKVTDEQVMSTRPHQDQSQTETSQEETPDKQFEKSEAVESITSSENVTTTNTNNEVRIDVEQMPLPSATVEKEPHQQLSA